MIRRGHKEHPFVVSVQFADLIFMMLGLFIIGLANASLTNPFAKYQEGYPHVDAGGLPGEVFFINMIFFMAPLFAVGFFRIVREAFRDFGKLFDEPIPK
jgi:hypothetical protein